jgi:hypothetical protein
MDIKDDFRKQLIDKFSRLYRGTQGGIFTKKTREKILTGKRISGRGIAKNQFWYRQRENVKTALIDLQLFVELTDKKDIDQVVTKESLEPIIGSLLLGVAVFNIPPDRNRAEIADMLIRLGFDYLEMKAGDHVNLSNRRTMREAVDLSAYLLQSIKGERYSRPGVGLERE